MSTVSKHVPWGAGKKADVVFGQIGDALNLKFPGLPVAFSYKRCANKWHQVLQSSIEGVKPKTKSVEDQVLAEKIESALAVACNKKVEAESPKSQVCLAHAT